MVAEVSSETAQWIMALWLFALGASIGSFLNVVVYRLPAGLGLVFPASHCPRCKRAIRWFDNVPVLGWILLRGRCRDCRLPIALRYPLVEAVCGALFVVLGVYEGSSGGANLPLVANGAPPTLALTDLALVIAFHALLLCTLLPAALIEYDGQQPPRRLFLPAIAVGVIAPCIWPLLHPAAPHHPASSHLASGLDGMAGATIGLIAGGLAALAVGGRLKSGPCWGLICVGLFLGWQAGLALGAWTCLAALALRMISDRALWARRIPPTAPLALATLAWILAWARLVR